MVGKTVHRCGKEEGRERGASWGEGAGRGESHDEGRGGRASGSNGRGWGGEGGVPHLTALDWVSSAARRGRERG